MKKHDDFDIIPLSEVKTAALKNPQVNEAYTDLQIRQAMMTELKAARQQCNLTQEEVAQRAGLKKQNISRMEKGIISPNLTTLSRYAAALGGLLFLNSTKHPSLLVRGNNQSSHY